MVAANKQWGWGGGARRPADDGVIPTSEDVSKMMADYIAKGGGVKKVPSGVSGIPIGVEKKTRKKKSESPDI